MQTVCHRLCGPPATSRTSLYARNHVFSGSAVDRNIRRWMSARPVDLSAAPAQGSPPPRKKVTLARLRTMARKGQPIAMLTAHDYPSALRASRSGNDIVLVGDSLAQVALGYDSTTRITMDEMIHHTRAVRRAVKADGDASMVVVDMPFGSYATGVGAAVGNAMRLVKEGGAEAVKLEGGEEVLETIRTLTRVGVPAVAHIGLCPQRHTQSSGYRVQGRDAHAAFRILQTAHAIHRSGACLMVLEAIPRQLATLITSSLNPPSTSPSSSCDIFDESRLDPLPTIGIGAGSGCSGQVLVQDDMLGFWNGHRPKFVRQFMPSDLTPSPSTLPPSLSSESESSSAESIPPSTSIGDLALSSARAYVQAVKSRTFPSAERGETYDMDPSEWSRFTELVRSDPVFGKMGLKLDVE